MGSLALGLNSLQQTSAQLQSAAQDAASYGTYNPSTQTYSGGTSGYVNSVATIPAPAAPAVTTPSFGGNDTGTSNNPFYAAAQQFAQSLNMFGTGAAIGANIPAATNVATSAVSGATRSLFGISLEDLAVIVIGVLLIGGGLLAFHEQATNVAVNASNGLSKIGKNVKVISELAA